MVNFTGWKERAIEDSFFKEGCPMETVKTAMFETLIESAKPDDQGGYVFTLEGKTYQIKDTLEISKIAQDHGYIIIY